MIYTSVNWAIHWRLTKNVTHRAMILQALLGVLKKLSISADAMQIGPRTCGVVHGTAVAAHLLCVSAKHYLNCSKTAINEEIKKEQISRINQHKNEYVPHMRATLRIVSKHHCPSSLVRGTPVPRIAQWLTPICCKPPFVKGKKTKEKGIKMEQAGKDIFVYPPNQIGSFFSSDHTCLVKQYSHSAPSGDSSFCRRVSSVCPREG